MAVVFGHRQLGCPDRFCAFGVEAICMLPNRVRFQTNPFGNGDAPGPRMSYWRLERWEWDRLQCGTECTYRYDGNRPAPLTDDEEPVVRRALNWLRKASTRCPSGYSLAWTTLAFLLRDRPAAELSLARLCEILPGRLTTLSTDTLSLAAIAIRASEGGRNPFKVT